MNSAAYPIFAWIGLITVLALAHLAARIELLRTLAVCLTFTLGVFLALAGFVLVAGL